MTISSNKPLHTLSKDPFTLLTHIHFFLYSSSLLALFYHHVTTPSPSYFLIIADIILTFMWATTQACRWAPVHRQEFPDRLLQAIAPENDLPALDIFICTADPWKEPPMTVVNTALSVMAYDYPTAKVSIYVSDDGGSDLTLFALMEAAKFARHWLPFCKENEILQRAPEAYFNSNEDECGDMMKDLGDISCFLGIEVKQTSEGGLHLCQKKYIQELLIKTKMNHAKPLPTPMISNLHLSKHKGEPINNATEYRSTVGGLQYATITRPDIAFSVNKVCQYMQHHLSEHWRGVKRILRYLNGTLNHGLNFRKCENLSLTAYVDADWGTDIDDRKSISGHCVFLGSNIVSWCSKKQPTISRSSTEAEYRCVASVTAELLWLESLFTELKVCMLRKPIIWCDNQSAISLAANPILHSRTKHMEIDLYFVREMVEKGKLNIDHIPSIHQRADILTKPLSQKYFSRFKDDLTVKNYDENCSMFDEEMKARMSEDDKEC